MMALTPKRLFLYLCISISLLRPYTLFSRSPLVNKTLFENACELEWAVLYFKVTNGRSMVDTVLHVFTYSPWVAISQQSECAKSRDENRSIVYTDHNTE